MTPSELEDRLVNFSADVLASVRKLEEDKISNHLGGQLIRSATSAALNYGEARGAESPNDFSHKMALVLKELRETYNSLRILSLRGYIPPQHPVLVECNELVAIFVVSVNTARRKLNR